MQDLENLGSGNTENSKLIFKFQKQRKTCKY